MERQLPAGVGFHLQRALKALPNVRGVSRTIQNPPRSPLQLLGLLRVNVTCCTKCIKCAGKKIQNPILSALVYATADGLELALGIDKEKSTTLLHFAFPISLSASSMWTTKSRMAFPPESGVTYQEYRVVRLTFTAVTARVKVTLGILSLWISFSAIRQAVRPYRVRCQIHTLGCLVLRDEYKQSVPFLVPCRKWTPKRGVQGTTTSNTAVKSLLRQIPSRLSKRMLESR
jgi:hypothetical protein